jgi:hypothetical protein
MSWGERSCENYGTCTRKPTMLNCNVDCRYYHSNGKEPDSRPQEVQGLLAEEQRGPGIVNSGKGTVTVHGSVEDGKAKGDSR